MAVTVRSCHFGRAAVLHAPSALSAAIPVPLQLITDAWFSIPVAPLQLSSRHTLLQGLDH